MPLRRRRPVLYEVARRREAAGLRSETPPDAGPEVVPHVAPTPIPRQIVPPTPVDSPATSVEMERGEIRLSLRWPALTVLGAGLIMSWAIAFQVGRHWSGATGAEETDDGALAMFMEEAELNPESGRDVTPNVAPPQSSPQQPKPPPPTPTAFEFESGKYYVKVQHFPRSRQQDAVDACKFLRSAGVPSHVWKRPDEFVLVATQPFDSASAARSLIRQIQALGGDYFKGGGGYDFQGCVARKIR